MDNPLRPQPLMAEVLPGFAVMVILGLAYYFAHPGTLAAIAGEKNTAAIVGGGVFVLFTSWIVGTFLDTVRDLAESLLDRWRPIRWQYLLMESAENIRKLEDAWLAYYFLNGNMAIGLLLATGLGFCPFLHMPLLETGGLVVVLLVYAVNFFTLRGEIRALIGSGQPHDSVYTRLMPSIIGGVGVFAIREIPKGALVFAPDDDALVHVSSAEVSEIRPELRKLYEDFAVLKSGSYICPTSFNKLTVSWYVNNSKTPNVEVDDALRLWALRNIEAGEELFTRYSDYSENDLLTAP